MTLQEIKDAVDAGKKVCWVNSLYEVRNPNGVWQRTGEVFMSAQTKEKLQLTLIVVLFIIAGSLDCGL